MSITEKIQTKYQNSKISTKITWTYAICFVILLALINAALWIGVSYALYIPAEHTIEYSMKNVQELLSKLEDDATYFNPGKVREPLVPGVVLRVADGEGNVFINTDPNYLADMRFEDYILKSPPLFANKDMEIARFGNALVYRAKLDYFHDNEHFILYFYRTITSMSHIFDQLALFLMFIDIFALVLAKKIGKVVSRSILQPVTEMTNLARRIAFEKLGERVPIPPANDELTELAKTLNAMLDRLEGGINRQQKFVSDASHELRTPATVIAGYIEILEKYGSSDKALMVESVEAIRSEAQNMKTLLENLLFLARTDQDRQKIYKTKFDLSELVSEVLRKMQTVITTHEVELLRNDRAEIFADRTMILQMLRIFLDNATKYTPEGGKITVRSEVAKGKIKLSIQDTGIGIAAQNLEKIFERSTRLDSEDLVKKVRGSGLGLSIAKWIAARHDIKIEVESQLGRGTKFILNIPQADKK